ncbi:MAG: AMP-binding protein [Paraglaciecola sp.]|uniref:non-ribosomal peptide synthetase family protein n=1 Tax=Paraglaciecola sp. TaxID=1920173 RepID=UPI0032657977
MNANISVANNIHTKVSLNSYNTFTELSEIDIDHGKYFSMTGHEQLVIERITTLASKYAEEIAIDASSKKLTYREYFHNAVSLCNLLKTFKVATNDRVIVFLDPSEHIPISLLAILMSGATYVPLDVTWPQERISAILDDVCPKAILTQNNYKHQFQHLTNVNIVDLDFAGEFAIETVTKPIHTKADLADVALIFYTSGSTGMPKGVKLTYGNLQSYIESSQETYKFNNSDTHLSIAKNSFSISIFDLLVPFYCGGSLKIKPRQLLLNPDSLSELVKDSTCFHMGPALLESLIYHAESIGLSYPNIRHISSGGDMIPSSLLERSKTVFPNSEIWVIYGCTEIACMGATWQVDRNSVTNVTYVGKSFKHSNILLLDETLTPVSTGELGEVYFTGDGVTPGYLNRKELNQTKFIHIDNSRYYATGDFGVIDETGNLQLKGRKDFQIKVNGIRIETEEIEHHLNNITCIEKSIVIGAKDIKEDVKIVAFVKKQEGTENFNENTVKQELAVSLPDYMVPNKIYPIDKFPLNTNGKLDRNELISIAEKSLTDNQSSISDKDEVAKKLEKLWFSTGLSGTIHYDSNFFDMGGDSLSAVQLVYSLNSNFGIDCDFEFIYTNPNFNSQLNTIKSGHVEAVRPPDTLVEPLDDKQNSSAKSVFITPGLYGHVVTFHNFGKRLSDKWKAYGLLCPNYEGETESSIEEIANRLANDIIKTQPEGPYYLSGHSSGAIVSLEIARKLQTLGKKAYVVMIEARLFDKAPRKPLRKVFMIYLKNKSRLYLERLLINKSSNNLTNQQDPNNRADQKRLLSLPKLKGAFTFSKAQVERYKITPCDIDTILIKGKQNIWWDALREWPDDYGLSEYVNLIGTLYSKGEHVSIVMERENHDELAQVLEESLSMFDS